MGLGRGDAFVYFMRPVGQAGPVKIGCSVMPERRLLALSEWSPVPLEIVATIPGRGDLEGRFHVHFADDYSHREWFRWSPRLEAVMTAVARGEFDVTTLPERGKLMTPEIGRVFRGLLNATTRYWGDYTPSAELQVIVGRVEGGGFHYLTHDEQQEAVVALRTYVEACRCDRRRNPPPVRNPRLRRAA